MTRKIGLGLLCAIAIFMTACGVPADSPVTAYCDALERQTALVKDGKFDKEAFKKEMTPLVAEVAKHKEKDSGKVPMSEKVLERWQKCINAVADTAKEKDNLDALMTQIEVMKPITVGVK